MSEVAQREELNLALTELEFAIVCEALNECPYHKLRQIRVEAKHTVITHYCTNDEIQNLCKKLTYTRNKLRS